MTLTKHDSKLHIIIQEGHEAAVVSVDGWDYGEKFEMVTVVQEC